MQSDLRQTSLKAGFMLGEGCLSSSPQKRQLVAAAWSQVLPTWYGSALHLVQKFLLQAGQRMRYYAMCRAASGEITWPLSSFTL